MVNPNKSLAEGLERFRRENPDIAEIIETYDNIERAYRKALEAMGIFSAQSVQVCNSAETIIAFKSDASSEG